MKIRNITIYQVKANRKTI